MIGAWDPLRAQAPPARPANAQEESHPASIAARLRRAAPRPESAEGAHPQARSKAVRAAAITFAAGIAVLAALAAVTLAKSPPRVVHIGAPGARAVSQTGVNVLQTTTESPTVCQAGEVVPAGVSAIRVSIWGFFGARVHLTAHQGSRLLTQGRRGANWTSDSVTIPVAPLRHQVSGATVCVAIGPNSEPLTLLGNQTPAAKAALIGANGAPPSQVTKAAGTRALQGRLALEYLAPSRVSWWSRIGTIAQHLGLGRSYSGIWIAPLLAAMMLAVGVLAIRLALRELQ